jgi:hypothetical protein
MAESITRWKQDADIQEALEHGEGNVARAIEEQTAKLPSDAWLWAAFASIGISLILHASGKREDGLFVGQWVAPFLLFGVYNKIVKVAGYDRISGKP